MDQPTSTLHVSGVFLWNTLYFHLLNWSSGKICRKRIVLGLNTVTTMVSCRNHPSNQSMDFSVEAIIFKYILYSMIIFDHPRVALQSFAETCDPDFCSDSLPFLTGKRRLGFKFDIICYDEPTNKPASSVMITCLGRIEGSVDPLCFILLCLLLHQLGVRSLSASRDRFGDRGSTRPKPPHCKPTWNLTTIGL